MTVAMAAGADAGDELSPGQPIGIDRANLRTANGSIQTGKISVRMVIAASIASLIVPAFASRELGRSLPPSLPPGATSAPPPGHAYAKTLYVAVACILGFTDGLAPTGAWRRCAAPGVAPRIRLAIVVHGHFAFGGFDAIDAVQEHEVRSPRSYPEHSGQPAT